MLDFSRKDHSADMPQKHKHTNPWHFSYANVGNEFLWELVAICRDCHEKAHGHD